MTPERWLKLKEIFDSAIKYQPDQRAMFLAEACSGDYSLRSEVESLIASHERSGSFIDSPAYEAAAELFVKEHSDLVPGEKIGSYEILSFISRGGMGEVYLAQDRRLSRKVALKLLPNSFTRDSDRLRRFEQEARAASALNHPNIITIYEIRQVGSTHAIATEFVEGQTLRQRLNGSALTVGEALTISIQIADALSAAHKAGIIHRDIKPDNIMLRPDGYVKVLDFGLAKLSEQAPASIAAEAPTRQVRTGSGIVMGTAGYMSPEQARGIPVDSRSDIFSLGAVIYEMVARRKPFHGDTPSDTLAAILKTEPPPLSQVIAGAPPELVRIVSKSLIKDREERYQVVKDLLIDLRTLKQELDFQAKLGQSVVPELAGATTVNRAADTSNTAARDGRSGLSSITDSVSLEIKRHKIGSAVVAFIILILFMAGAFGFYKLLNPTPLVAHFQNMKLTRLTNSGNAIDATISPDGKYLVYVLSDRSKQSLWIRQVSTANDKQILPPARVGFFGITFSRDGNDLYYAVKANLDSGVLYKIPVLGGTPIKILEQIDCPVSFSPDGKQFAFLRSNSTNVGESLLIVANGDGSGERTLSTRKLPEKFSPLFFTGPAWSPDGKLIAVTVATTGGSSRVVAVSAAGGAERPLSAETWAFAGRVEWLTDMSGLLVIAGDAPAVSQVWIIDYPNGATRRVTNDLNSYRTVGLTADGTKFSTIQANGLVNVWVLPHGDSSRAVQLPTGNVGFYGAQGNTVCWTSDGHIVFISNEGGASDIWSMDPDGNNRKQLTSGGGSNLSPVVTPDGRYIVFSSTRNGAKNIWRINVDGSNATRLTSGLAELIPDVSADGKWVAYTVAEGAKPTLWKVSIDGGTPVQLTDHFGEMPTFSPDGQKIAFLYADSPDPYAPPNRIGIIEASGTLEKTVEMPPSGTVSAVIHWSVDGKSILYSVNMNNVSNIWSQSIDGGPPKQVTDFKDSLMTGFAWSRDGKNLVCSRGVLMRDAVLITDVK
ncbi:MAG: protein kinase [Pyrinomonadaceae bacterium]